MREDILQAARSGADGVVFGLLTQNGDIDLERTRELVHFARPMEVTFHRAIDMVRDMDSALEDSIQSGADRLLTSGGAQSALLGAARIERMILHSQGRIKIMVCGGIRAQNYKRDRPHYRCEPVPRGIAAGGRKHRPASLFLEGVMNFVLAESLC